MCLYVRACVCVCVCVCCECVSPPASCNCTSRRSFGGEISTFACPLRRAAIHAGIRTISGGGRNLSATFALHLDFRFGRFRRPKKVARTARIFWRAAERVGDGRGGGVKAAGAGGHLVSHPLRDQADLLPTFLHIRSTLVSTLSISFFWCTSQVHSCRSSSTSSSSSASANARAFSDDLNG